MQINATFTEQTTELKASFVEYAADIPSNYGLITYDQNETITVS